MFSFFKNNPALRRFLFWLLKNRYVTKDHYIDGKKQYYNSGRNLGLLLKKKVIIEPVITANMHSLLKENFTIFDIGANIGYYTILFSHCTPKGKVIAVEPDPYSIPTVEKNIEINSLKNVTLVKSAICDKEGETVFYLDISTGQTSSIVDGVFHPKGAILKETRLQCTTMDKLSEKYGFPHLIKCDVEGAELMVFNKASETLKRKPVLMVEVKEESAAELFQKLKEHNYKIYDAEKPLKGQAPLAQISVPNIFAI